jgi:hypothetical protein
MGIHAQYHHAQPWILPNGLGGDFDAVELGHGDVQNCEIRLKLLAEVQGFSPITCLTHNLNARLILEQSPQAAPDNVVIIR